MDEFHFQLGDQLVIRESGESGVVVGRAQYANGTEPSYLLRYKAGDGRATECWWTQNALDKP